MTRKQYKLKKKAELKQKHKKKREFVRMCAKRLQNNVPKSEIWFNELYKRHKYTSDQTNIVFGGKIPDIINKRFKYIIEVDGSIHDLPHVIEKDIAKTKYNNSIGYMVFRVRHHHADQVTELVQILNVYRQLWIENNIKYDGRFTPEKLQQHVMFYFKEKLKTMVRTSDLKIHLPTNC